MTDLEFLIEVLKIYLSADDDVKADLLSFLESQVDHHEL